MADADSALISEDASSTLLPQPGDVSTLAKQLADARDERLRSETIRALLDIGTPEAIAAIEEWIKTSPEPVCGESLALLGSIPGDAALQALAGGLAAEDWFVRSRAARALAARSEPQALVYLLRAARDPAPALSRLGTRLLTETVRRYPKRLHRLRKENLEGIIAILPPEDAERLLFADVSEKVRQVALGCMAKSTNPEVISFLVETCRSGSPSEAETALSVIEKNPHIPSTAIASLLEAASASFRPRLFRIFAERCGSEGVELLSRGLGDEDASIRKHAVTALFRLFGEPLLSLFLPLINDKDTAVGLAVLDCIDRCSPHAADDAIMAAALQGASDLRRRALRLAAAKGLSHEKLTPHYLDLLLEILADPRPTGEPLDLACDILKLFAEMKDPRVQPGLIKACLTASARLRRMGLEAIEALPPEYRLTAYEGLIDTPDEAVAAKVAFALEEAGNPKALIPLIRTAMSNRKRDAKRARECLDCHQEMLSVETLCELLRSPHARVKQYAIERLGELGDPEMVQRLVRAIETGDEETRIRILEELRERRIEGTKAPPLRLESVDQNALEALLRAADDEDEAVQFAAVEELEKFISDPRVVARLIAFLDYGGIAVRQKAVEILGRCQVKEAVEPLIRLLGNIFLRSYVEEALRLIGDRRGYLAIVRKRKREKMFPSRAKLEREKIRRPAGRPGMKFRR